MRQNQLESVLKAPPRRLDFRLGTRHVLGLSPLGPLGEEGGGEGDLVVGAEGGLEDGQGLARGLGDSVRIILTL